MTESHTLSLGDALKQSLEFVRFVVRRFPIVYLALLVTIFTLGLEYAAVSLMMPLAGHSSGASTGVIVVWRAIANFMGLPDQYRTWLWLFLSLMGLRMIAGLSLSVLTVWIGKQVHLSLSSDVFAYIVNLAPIRSLYEKSVGYYINLAGDDTFKSGTLVNGFLQVLVGSLSALVSMLVLWQFSPLALQLLCAFLIICVVLVGVGMVAMLKATGLAINQSRAASTTFIEALNSLRSLRSLKSEEFVTETYHSQMSNYVSQLIRVETIRVFLRTTPALVLIILGLFSIRPGVDLGVPDATVFAATLIIMRVFAALGQILTSGGQLISDVRAMKDIKGLLHILRKSEIKPSIPVHDPIQSLALNRVSFGFDRGFPIFKNFSYEFTTNRLYAIVGPSGCGKSTLADILLGLIPPDQGEVSANGGKLNQTHLRSRVVLVEQHSKIFSGTIRENLLLGLKSSDQELHEALDAVALGETIRELELGLDTRVTYQGENFSGGQRQRIGIARALIRNPDVLILDEATSALDEASRKLVVSRLRAKMSPGIVIFITHDKAIESLADVVLDIGKLNERSLKLIE